MLSGRDEAKEYVLSMVRENDVKFIRLWFTDILGNLKGFSIGPAQLEEALEHGIGFDGSSIEGFARIDESDMVAMPDPTTFRILPWRPKENSVARMFCDILTPDGLPFQGDPRYVLKRNLERATQMGYTYYVGPELEYFYVKGPQDPEPLDQGGYFDQLTMGPANDLRRETVLTLGEMGVPVKDMVKFTLAMPDELRVFQRLLFSKIVPNCKKLGLLDAGDGWLRDRFTDIGVIQFEDWIDTGEEYADLDEVAKDREAAQA